MGSFAEFERALIRERQKEGIALAKKAGVYKGRKPSLDDAKLKELKRRIASGDKKAAIARDFGIHSGDAIPICTRSQVRERLREQGVRRDPASERPVARCSLFVYHVFYYEIELLESLPNAPNLGLLTFFRAFWTAHFRAGKGLITRCPSY